MDAEFLPPVLHYFIVRLRPRRYKPALCLTASDIKEGRSLWPITSVSRNLP